MLVHPQSQLLREPRLLVPKLGPLGSVRANLDNPTVRKLTYLAVGHHKQNLMRGNMLTRGAGALASFRASGLALVGNAANALAVADSTTGFTFSSGYTYLVFAEPVSAAAKEAAISINSTVAGGQSYILFNCDSGYANSAGTLTFLKYAGGAALGFSSSGKVDGVPHAVAYQRKESGTNNTNCWYDSQLLGAFTDNCNFEAGAVLTISGISGYTGYTRTTPYFLTAFAPVALTNAEIMDWCRDPFSLVVPA